MSVLNVFRMSGDLLHLASILILLYKVHLHKNAAGISLKSQQIYVIVFVSRYLDLFVTLPHSFLSTYNYVMKLIFLASSMGIVYIMMIRHGKHYDRVQESSIKIWWLIAPAAVLALVFHQKFTIRELFWTFSIFLEAVAIVPQLMLLQRSGSVENITADYVMCLGGYRAMYMLNWIYRFYTEGKTQWIVWASGTAQTIIYLDFFYYYWNSRMKGKKMELPQ